MSRVTKGLSGGIYGLLIVCLEENMLAYVGRMGG